MRRGIRSGVRWCRQSPASGQGSPATPSFATPRSRLAGLTSGGMNRGRARPQVEPPRAHRTSATDISVPSVQIAGRATGPLTEAIPCSCLPVWYTKWYATTTLNQSLLCRSTEGRSRRFVIRVRWPPFPMRRTVGSPHTIGAWHVFDFRAPPPTRPTCTQQSN